MASSLICNISDVMEYEPDADMIFNYLMVSALAAATDYVEKEGLKPSGGETDLVFLFHSQPGDTGTYSTIGTYYGKH